jgi:hypothetical protein
METTVELIEYLNSLFRNLKGNPTHIYNEGWMLRLVLHWFAHRDVALPLATEGYSEGAKKFLTSIVDLRKDDTQWYSEAKLSSPFLATPGEKKMNKEMGLKSLSEGHTQPDAVYGNFEIRNQGDTTNIKLKNQCHQFIVVEAKMNSPYDTGVTNVKKYNQAARTVACMSKVIEHSQQSVKDVKDVAFYTLLPKARKDEKSKFYKATFHEFTTIDHIRGTVQNRINVYKEREEERVKYREDYRGEYHKKYAEIERWHNDYFLPLLSRIKIELITWEEVRDFIISADPSIKIPLTHFYDNCLTNNKLPIE